MNVDVLEKTENTVRFTVSDVDSGFANALRRIMVSEIPTLAVDEVVVFENTSPLADEVLSHRIGLVPLKTDLDTYEKVGTEVRLVLRAEAAEEPTNIYSGHLQAEDPAVVPVSEKILLAKLAPRQRIVLEATARVGWGKDHAKWQTVSAATYKFMPTVEVLDAKHETRAELVKECPRDIFYLDNDRLKVQNEPDCILCRICEEISQKQAVEVGWREDKFIFLVETIGSIPVERIIQRSSEILRGKADQFVENLEAVTAG